MLTLLKFLLFTYDPCSNLFSYPHVHFILVLCLAIKIVQLFV